MTYLSSKSNIHIIARAIIIHKDKLVVLKVKNKDWCFLPGGHIETGEDIKQGLKRELKEEISINEQDIKQIEFVSFFEHIFDLDKKKKQHEINFIYKVIINKETDLIMKEHDLLLQYYSLSYLSEIDLRPKQIKSIIFNHLS